MPRPAPAAVWEQLDPYVADMTSGRGGEEIDALAGYGIRYVRPAPGSSRDLIPTLDGEPGLRRLSSSGGEVLWRVAGITARARVVEADIVDALSGSRPTEPSRPIPTSTRRCPTVRRRGRWSWAPLPTPAGGPCRWPLTAPRPTSRPHPAPACSGGRRPYEAPDGAAPVRVWFDSTSRDRWLWLQVIVLLVLVVPGTAGAASGRSRPGSRR